MCAEVAATASCHGSSGRVPLQAQPVKELLYEAVRAALAPVAHLESRYNETEFGRRVREKIRRELSDLKDSSSAGIAKFVGGSLSRMWQREHSRGWVPHVDWESIFVAALQEFYRGCLVDLNMISQATKAAIADWMRLHVHNRPVAVTSPSGTNGPLPKQQMQQVSVPSVVPKQSQRPVFTPYGAHARKGTPEPLTEGPLCLTSQEQPPDPVLVYTAVCGETAAESMPACSSRAVIPEPVEELGATGMDADAEEDAFSKAAEHRPVLPTWAWLGDAGPPATDTLQCQAVATETLLATPASSRPPPPPPPPPLQLRRPPPPPAEPLPCASALGGDSMSSSAPSSEHDRFEKEACPQPSPGSLSLAGRCRWDDAVQVGERGAIEVSLKGRGLDASAIQGWCFWAKSSLPRLARSRQRGGRIATLHMDFSDNKICSEGMETLADFLVHGLQGMHLRCLRLHRNSLTASAATPIARLIGVLGSRPRSAIEELHLSHNALGQEGVMTVLESIAGARASGGAPAYPISIMSPAGTAEGTMWKPLWLRIENNGQTQETHDEFVKQVNTALTHIRQKHGWLSEEEEEPLGMMLCPCWAPGSKCTIGRCTRQHGQQWPIAHIACWYSSPESVPFAARPKRASSRPRKCSNAALPKPPYNDRPREVQSRPASRTGEEQSAPSQDPVAGSHPVESENWRCPHCDETVSSRRSRCFACGEPRPTAGSTSVSCPQHPSSSAASITSVDVGQDVASLQRFVATWNLNAEAQARLLALSCHVREKVMRNFSPKDPSRDNNALFHKFTNGVEQRPTSGCRPAAHAEQAILVAEPSGEDEWKKLRMDVDNTVAEIARTLLLPALARGGTSGGQRASYVVLSSQGLGKAYQRSVLHEEVGLSWEGVRAAHEYYHAQNVKVLTVVNESRAHHVPPDLASQVILAPKFGHGHPLDQLDLFMLRLSMEFDCQYVDNRQRYMPDMLHSDLQEWLAGRGEYLKVEFVFDVNGRFIPLKPPPACNGPESHF